MTHVEVCFYWPPGGAAYTFYQLTQGLMFHPFFIRTTDFRMVVDMIITETL